MAGRRSLIRLAAVALLVAAAYAGLPLAPASAATCSTSIGVSVVVDFHQLGGGVQTTCVAGGGGESAAAIFSAAGVALTYVQRTPGFVCRVSGVPADDPCVNTPPADAYWGLWWSDGTSGSWNYATVGAGSLHVPEGGYVAFSWNGTSARATPGAAPAPHRPVAPTRTPSPSAATNHPAPASPTASAPTPSASTTSASAEPTPTAASSATRHRARGHEQTGSPTAARGGTATSAEPEASPTADAVTSPAATPAAADGLPGWVAPAVIVVLFAAAGTVALVRRRRGAA